MRTIADILNEDTERLAGWCDQMENKFIPTLKASNERPAQAMQTETSMSDQTPPPINVRIEQDGKTVHIQYSGKLSTEQLSKLLAKDMESMLREETPVNVTHIQA